MIQSLAEGAFPQKTPDLVGADFVHESHKEMRRKSKSFSQKEDGLREIAYPFVETIF